MDANCFLTWMLQIFYIYNCNIAKEPYSLKIIIIIKCLYENGLI